MRTTVPATGVVIEASIFIASILATMSPTATCSPTATPGVTLPLVTPSVATPSDGGNHLKK
jgi:hypothetical protein